MTQEESSISVGKSRRAPFVILFNYRSRRAGGGEEQEESSAHEGFEHSCGSYSDTEELALEAFYRQAWEGKAEP
jgi:hypothetical protein